MSDAKETALWTSPYVGGVLPFYVFEGEEKPFSPYKVEVTFSPRFFVTGKLLFPCEVGIAFYPVSSTVHSCYVLPFKNNLVRDWDPFGGEALCPFFGGNLYSSKLDVAGLTPTLLTYPLLYPC